ncbi:hypothetical protein TEA_014308 [Camellia sinensis var. sinensis]|uniref:Syndetin C-terminal domain-containing protein n=1 Tax=Camellia sinensis var. sinensis TaxID=542762 RepID=A0A4S4EC61_CAMSN|nr:hypothetical protein TEA_014308 [Camellia sinensis var. sinensis]
MPIHWLLSNGVVRSEEFLVAFFGVPARAVAAAAVARALAGLPPHQRYSLPSSSEELSSIYGSKPHGQVVEELEEEFYEEVFLAHDCQFGFSKWHAYVLYWTWDPILFSSGLGGVMGRLLRQYTTKKSIEFDPVRHVLEHMPSEENDVAYFEEKATVRLAQLDSIAERLSRHVMEHHEEMVHYAPCDGKSSSSTCRCVILINPFGNVDDDELGIYGMHLVRELEKDLKVANVICMNGRRHLTSSRNEVSRDLIVTTSSKKKQVLLDMLPILTELRHALDMQVALENHVEEGNFFKAFQVLSEYLQLLDSFSELSAIQEMSHGVEVWLGKTLQKLDSLLLGVCQDFKEDGYITVSACHAPHIKQKQRDVPGVSGDVQHVDTVKGNSYSSNEDNGLLSESMDRLHTTATTSSINATETNGSMCINSSDSVDESRNGGSEASSSGSPWFQLRKDATVFVSQTLQRGRKNLWQLTTSRVSVLLSSAAVSSSSIHQFLINYEDLNIFILAGEAFCGAKAVEFRQKVKAVCENYLVAFHRQNIYALKMVLEKENWLKLPPETIQVVSFAGLVGDGAALIVPSERNSSNKRVLHSNKSADSVETGPKKSGFSYWLKSGNPFLVKLSSKEYHDSFSLNGSNSGESDGKINENSQSDKFSPKTNDANHVNGSNSVSEDENEDLHADFIDEDSQLPSRISKPNHSRNNSSHCNDEEMTAQTGSSLCLLRLMDKYARLMQKLEIVNVEFFKGIYQLFGIFFHFVFETFGQQNTFPSGKGLGDSLSFNLVAELASVPLCIGYFLLKRKCADTISIVARLLLRSKAHLQLMLLQNNAAVVEDFYAHLVDSVPDLVQHIHRTTARLLLHINGLQQPVDFLYTIDLVVLMGLHVPSSGFSLVNFTLVSNFGVVHSYLEDNLQLFVIVEAIEKGHDLGSRPRYVDRISNAKWEVKELGLEHNGYVDLLLGEFKHYKTRLAHGGIPKEVQDLLLEYGVEIVAETLIEGLSRVKRCSDEGRALMSLDLQVLINGLQHFVPTNVKPKLQTVETFIKVNKRAVLRDMKSLEISEPIKRTIFQKLNMCTGHVLIR